jgi:hypothetical protein
MGTAATGTYDLVRQPTNGSASQEPMLVDRTHKLPQDVSPDGRSLVYGNLPTQSTNELWILPLADRRPSLYIKHGSRLRLAPNGRWAVYASDEFGRSQIFMQSFPTPGTKVQITTEGGNMPVWSRDGREIFYQAAGRLLAVPVSISSGTPSTGPATALFTLPSATDYDVSPDGRFLFAVPVDRDSQTPAAILTLNWKSGLKRDGHDLIR